MPLTLLLAVLAAEPQTDEELGRHVEEQFPSRLTVREPFFDLPEGRVTAVTVALSGRSLGNCKESPREARELCFEADGIAPGDHILELRLTVKDKKTLFPSSFSGAVRVRFSPHATHALSVKGSVQPGAAVDQYFRRVGEHKHPDGCLKALETLAAAPACKSADLRAARAGISDAKARCAGAVAEQPWARSLAARAVENVLLTEVDRCFEPEVRKKLSSRITDRYGADRLWPEDTLTVGSWSWARGLPLAEDRRRETVIDELAELEAHLQLADVRMQVVERIVQAELAGKTGARPLLEETTGKPFSFDPRTPHGHLWFSAVSLAERYDVRDPQLSDKVAAQVVKDGTLHCGLHRETDVLWRFFLRDQQLSTAEWKAATAMMERTPPGARLNRCDHAADPRLESEISAVDRAAWLGGFDCSERRHEALRGHSFSSTVRLGEAELETVRARFERCLR